MVDLKPVNTKLMYEPRKGRFLSLGFGNAALSGADILMVAAYSKEDVNSEEFRSIAGHGLNDSEWDEILSEIEIKPGSFQLIDMGNYPTGYTWLGVLHNTRDRDALQFGLAGGNQAIEILSDQTSMLQLDLAIRNIGNRYIHRNKSMNIILEWARDLLNRAENVTNVRFVTDDIDNFIHIFEAIFQLKNMEVTPVQFGMTDPDVAGSRFAGDLTTAIDLLGTNPKQSVVICRTIIDGIVRELAKRTKGINFTTIFETTKLLFSLEQIPHHIYSYINTCRIIGNEANHTNFQPTSQDAEGVIVLTMNIVNWFEESQHS